MRRDRKCNDLGEPNNNDRLALVAAFRSIEDAHLENAEPTSAIEDNDGKLLIERQICAETLEGAHNIAIQTTSTC